MKLRTKILAWLWLLTGLYGLGQSAVIEHDWSGVWSGVIGLVGAIGLIKRKAFGWWIAVVLTLLGCVASVVLAIWGGVTDAAVLTVSGHAIRRTTDPVLWYAAVAVFVLISPAILTILLTDRPEQWEEEEWLRQRESAEHAAKLK